MRTTPISPDYDRLSQQIGWGTNDAHIDSTKAHLLDQWVVGKTVLDVGCATGVYSHYLAQNGFDVTGIDHNPRLLTLAKKRTTSVTFTQADTTRLPFADHSFDTVVAFDILEHVDESLMMRELVRVARKRIILCVPATTDPDLAQLSLLYGHHIDTTHLRTYTPASLRKMLASYKLSSRLIQSTHPLSTDAVFLALFSAPLVIRRGLRKIAFTFGKPRQFFTNIVAIADKR